MISRTISPSEKKHSVEVWAQLLLCDVDCERIKSFLVETLGIKPRSVSRRMHITVYHARRPMPGVQPIIESACVVVPAKETRFMVLAPGGENPKPDLDPAKRKVGIRIQRGSIATPSILEYRSKLLRYETESVLGGRTPSSHKNNAFGARYFQPHMTILNAGSGINRDLKNIGEPFRELIGIALPTFTATS